MRTTVPTPVGQAQHEGAGFEELGKMVGARWRSLSDADKAPYIKKATSDKERYKMEMDAYVAYPFYWSHFI